MKDIAYELLKQSFPVIPIDPAMLHMEVPMKVGDH
jgi:hypothetical protein